MRLCILHVYRTCCTYSTLKKIKGPRQRIEKDTQDRTNQIKAPLPSEYGTYTTAQALA